MNVLGRALSLAAMVTLFAFASPARAIDHDNIDAGRPLRFEDADSIAFRERAFEFGIAPAWPSNSRFGVGLSAEYLYGFALNSHFSVDFDPSFGGRAGTSDTRADFGRVGLGVFHNLNRETLNTPAFAVRADAYLPTARGSRGVDLRLRGIASRTLRGSERLHVNVDAAFRTGAGDGARAVVPAPSVTPGRSATRAASTVPCSRRLPGVAARRRARGAPWASAWGFGSRWTFARSLTWASSPTSPVGATPPGTTFALWRATPPPFDFRG